jgi:hypothetical protein
MTKQQREHSYYALEDVDARGVYAFGAFWRKSLPQQGAHDLGGSPSCAGSKYDLLGNSQVSTVSDGVSAPVIVPPAGAGGATMPPPMAGGGGGLRTRMRRAKQRCSAPSNMSVFAWRVDWTRRIMTPGDL